MEPRKKALIIGVAASLAAMLVAAGCGASPSSTSASSPPPSASPPPTASPAPPSAPATGQAAGALTGEAASASAGDIPDNQVFLTLNDKALGFSMKYPEGWAQKAKGNALTIQDKNNIVRVAVAGVAAPYGRNRSRSELSALKQKEPSLKAGTPTGRDGLRPSRDQGHLHDGQRPQSSDRQARHAGWSTAYYFWQGGKVAVMGLGTPQGVDNVDAYRLMSESFAWK